MFWSIPPAYRQRSPLHEEVVLPFLSVELRSTRHWRDVRVALVRIGVTSRGSEPATVFRQSV